MKSVGRSLEVLECVADHQPVGVSEVARVLGEPKSSVQRALDTLSKGKWIMRDHANPSQWVVAVRTAMLGRNFAGKLDISTVALAYMETLRQETQETIHLAVPREASMILIERLESPHPLRYVEPLGGKASIFRTATGKSVLASLPDSHIDELIEQYHEEFTDSEETRESLWEELTLIRQYGFATTSRWRSDVYATAAVIPDAQGAPLAALSISVPANRITTELKHKYAELVTTAAKDISGRLRQ